MKGLGKGVKEFKDATNKDDDSTDKVVSIDYHNSLKRNPTLLTEKSISTVDFVPTLSSKNRNFCFKLVHEVYHEEAIAFAKTVDEKIKNKTAGLLAGMVIGIKDNLSYKDHNITGSSKILTDFMATQFSFPVEKLLRKIQ